MTFLVTVSYREPIFEAQVGHAGPPYRWTFVIDAPSAELAIAHARAEFQEIARASSVGWTREIVAWDVRPLPTPATTAP